MEELKIAFWIICVLVIAKPAYYAIRDLIKCLIDIIKNQ